MDAGERRAARAAADAVDELDEPNNTLTLQSGVVLRLSPVPPELLRRAASKIPEPQVPRIYLEDKGREENNPNDPAYLKALEERIELQTLAQVNVAVLYGTAIERVPEGFPGPDDRAWWGSLVEDGFLTEDDVGTERRRYLNWVLMRAALGSDETLLFARVIALCGLTEGEVQEVVSSFRGRGIRGDDRSATPETSGADGDNVSPAVTGARTRDRGA